MLRWYMGHVVTWALELLMTRDATAEALWCSFGALLCSADQARSKKHRKKKALFVDISLCFLLQLLTFLGNTSTGVPSNSTWITYLVFFVAQIGFAYVMPGICV